MKIEFVSKADYLVSEINIKDIFKQRYCIFDLESTGFNHEEEFVTQIGAIILENNIIQYSSERIITLLPRYS